MKIIVGITGASGSIYAKNLILKLNTLLNPSEVELVYSQNAHEIWEYELDEFVSLENKVFENNNFNAPFASGSSLYDAMVVVPCSMSKLAKIANGISDDLVTRAADVMLKERRKLILVTRETPLNLIQIDNMKKATLAGAVLLPASPSFYSKPSTIDDVVNSVVDRIIDQLEILNVNANRWNIYD